MAHRRPWARALSVTPVARGAASAFAVRVAGSACGFGSAVLLTRALGASGYGAYAWALAWTVALARPAGLGATLLLTRHVAAAELHDRPGSRLLATRVAGVVAVAAAAIALVVALVVVVVRVADHQSETTLLVALPALPAAALIGIPQGVLQGLGRPGLGVLPATLLQQAPFLAVVLLAWGLTGGRLSPAFAGAALAATSVVALCAGALMAGRALPRRTTAPRVSMPGGRAVMRPLLPLAVVDTAQVLHASCGVALLGIVASSHDVAIYAVATLLTGPLGLAVAAGSAAVGPMIASRHAAADRQTLRVELLRVSRALGAASAVAAAAIALFDGPLLSLFGPGFTHASQVLLILLAANVINALAPFNGLALVMTDHAGMAAKAAIAGLVVLVACSLALMPSHGAVGAAVAFLLSTTVRNVLNSIAAWRVLAVDTTVLGRGLGEPAPARIA